jgi:parallel beta-helix repeat protein
MITLMGMLIGFKVHNVEASETIYIRTDGSVEPSTVNITSIDNVTYIFTDDIHDSIVVERDNIVVDGAGYTVQGTGSGKGIGLDFRCNITIKNIEIKAFDLGIGLYGSSNNTISGNNLTNNGCSIWIQKISNNNRILGNIITNNTDNGIVLLYSSNNTISGNDITNNDHGMYLCDSSRNTISGNIITNNRWDGIQLYLSSFNLLFANIITANKAGVRLLYFANNNRIYENSMTNNEDGIGLWASSKNNVYGNNIADNYFGMRFSDSSDNRIYHNNFVNNTKQLYNYNSKDIWDDDYPSGGNYWSDYQKRYPNAIEIDNSGIWDTPYVIDENNRDNYPIIPEFPSFLVLQLFMIATLLAVIVHRRKLSV